MTSGFSALSVSTLKAVTRKPLVFLGDWMRVDEEWASARSVRTLSTSCASKKSMSSLDTTLADSSRMLSSVSPD